MPKLTLQQCAKKTINDIEKRCSRSTVNSALIYWNAVKVLDPKDREHYRTRDEGRYDTFGSRLEFTEEQRMYLFEHYVHNEPMSTHTGSR